MKELYKKYKPGQVVVLPFGGYIYYTLIPPTATSVLNPNILPNQFDDLAALPNTLAIKAMANNTFELAYLPNLIFENTKPTIRAADSVEFYGLKALLQELGFNYKADCSGPYILTDLTLGEDHREVYLEEKRGYTPAPTKPRVYAKYYRTYEKVLVRTCAQTVWVAAEYSHYDDVNDIHYILGGIPVREIIPYQRNEDLAGKRTIE